LQHYDGDQHNQTQDEPFVPYTITPEQRAKVDQGELPHPNKPSLFALYERWVIPFVMLFLGWPLYLVPLPSSPCYSHTTPELSVLTERSRPVQSINASGPPKKDLVSHYDPKASIFNKKDWWKILLSGMHLYLPLEPLTFYDDYY
jgi:hypothetical protein